MSDTAAMQANGSTLASKKPVLKLLLKTVVAGLMLTALLFLAAGRVDWPIAWVFVAFFQVPSCPSHKETSTSTISLSFGFKNVPNSLDTIVIADIA